jgi:CubicO group peptidase (beta-lactamase class C family)
MGLLGHILSLRADVSFDQLVKDRILDILAMDSTGMRMNASGMYNLIFDFIYLR